MRAASGACMTIEELEDRVGHVERKLRRWKNVTIGLIGMFALSLTGAAGAAFFALTQPVTVVDFASPQHESARLTAEGLEFRSGGRVHAMIRNDGTILLDDDAHHPRFINARGDSR